MKTQSDRAEEMDKALLMAQLFREPYFSQITGALKEYEKKGKGKDAETTAKKTLKEACDKAAKERGQKEIAEKSEWLWNYLKNYDPALAGPTW